MRLRAFTPAVHGFLDTVREGHPTTPLLVVSAVLCPVQEDTPGPLAPDFEGGTLRFKATGDPAERSAGRLTLNIIRDELARIVEQRTADDPNLHYLDGRDLGRRGGLRRNPATRRGAPRPCRTSPYRRELRAARVRRRRPLRHQDRLTVYRAPSSDGRAGAAPWRSPGLRCPVVREHL